VEVGDLLAKFVLGMNDRIDTTMGSTAFGDRSEDFEEVSLIAGEVIADRIELTPERLLMIRVAALYASTYAEARGQRKLIAPSNEEE